MNRLTSTEERAASVFLARLRFPRNKTRHLVVVTMLGVPGSGKSAIARAIAAKIGAVVIKEDLVRVEMRKVKAPYDNAGIISHRAMMEALGRRSNAVIDSDHINDRKNRELAAAAKALKARLLFVQVSMDLDVMIGRILVERHRVVREDFFGGARTTWQGDKKLRGSVVKMREMIRRIPHHYQWSAQGGGRWVLKKRPWVFAVVDATDRNRWQKATGRIVAHLKRR